MADGATTFSLTSKNISSVGVANKQFGSDTSLLVARPDRACCNYLWFTVPEGFFALVTRHGADEDYTDGSPVWPPGLHLGPPWLKVSHLVTKQSIVLQTPVQGCKTKDNVTVNLDMALVMRVMGDSAVPGDDPANVRTFVHSVTAMGLQQQLRDAQAEAVRTLARSVTHTEVFGLRSVSNEELTSLQGKLDTTASSPFSTMQFGGDEGEEEESKREIDQEEKDMVGEHDSIDEMEADFAVETGANVTDIMKERLNEQFMPQGVQILSVIIENISLPFEIQKQMSDKTMVISQNAEQRMQQKHDMLVLEQDEAIKTLQQTHQEQKLEFLEDGDQQAQLQNIEFAHEKAVGAGALSMIIAQMTVDVDLVSAESDLTVQRIRDTTKLETERIQLEAERDSTKIYADIDVLTQTTQAKAELESSRLMAKGDKAVFSAEGDSAPKMRVFNEYTTRLRKLSVQDSLVSNNELVITGTSGGEAANQLIMADAALSSAKHNHSTMTAEERSRLLSELAVSSGNAQIRIHVGGPTTGGSNYS